MSRTLNASYVFLRTASSVDISHSCAQSQETRRFEKCATVPGPPTNAIAPLVTPSLRSFITSAGWSDPCTYSLALTPLTVIFTLVHRSQIDIAFIFFRSLFAET